jgi:L-Ala-D/L-Glu epimerase
MPEITNVSTIPYRLPLRVPLRWGKHSQLSEVYHVLLRVELADGSVGIAEAPPRPTIYGETVASIGSIVEYLMPKLLRVSIDDEHTIASVLSSVANNHCARGALDMALWEARVASRGQHVFDVLAGPRDRVRVSYILGIASLKDMLAEAKRVVAAGVRVLKVKVGRDFNSDLAVIHALNTEFAGIGVSLYADSNETLDQATSAQAIAAMRDAGLLYVEEPLPVRQIQARAALKRQHLLPIIADDSCLSIADLERELMFDTFDVLNIKTARTGFSESLKMLALAQNHGKSLMLGSQASTTIGAVHAAVLASHEAVDCPSELSFFLNLADDIVHHPLIITDGHLSMADARRVSLNPEQLNRYRTR